MSPFKRRRTAAHGRSVFSKQRHHSRELIDPSWSKSQTSIKGFMHFSFFSKKNIYLLYLFYEFSEISKYYTKHKKHKIYKTLICIFYKLSLLLPGHALGHTAPESTRCRHCLNQDVQTST